MEEDTLNYFVELSSEEENSKCMVIVPVMSSVYVTSLVKDMMKVNL